MCRSLKFVVLHLLFLAENVIFCLTMNEGHLSGYFFYCLPLCNITWTRQYYTCFYVLFETFNVPFSLSHYYSIVHDKENICSWQFQKNKDIVAKFPIPIISLFLFTQSKRYSVGSTTAFNTSSLISSSSNSGITSWIKFSSSGISSAIMLRLSP